MRTEIVMKIIDDDGKSTFTTINPDGKKSSAIEFDHVHMDQQREVLDDTPLGEMNVRYKPGRLRMMFKLWQGEENVKYDDLKVLEPLEVV